MSLYIVFDPNDPNPILDSGFPLKELELHVQNHVPDKVAPKVQFIQADGDELNWIVSHITGIRQTFPCPRVVRWYGDDAKFIVGNIKYRWCPEKEEKC